MTFSKSKIFLIFCIAFIVGIFLGRVLNYTIMAVSAMVFIIAGTIWFNNKIVFILSIAGVLVLTGAVRFKTNYSQNDLAQFYGQKAQVTGIISQEPDIRPDKIYLTLGHVIVNNQPVHSKMLLSMPKSRQFEYGEKLEFESKITEPKEYPDFSYKNYLSRFGIDAVAYMPQIHVVPGNYGNRAQLWLLRLKQKFVDTESLFFPEPQNSFLAGLLLGAKRAIPESLMDQFNKTGTSHIVVISGFNITIIAMGISYLLQWLGLHKRVSFFVSVIAIILFVMMTGASASAVRAGIMGILLLMALNVGRLSVAANVLSITAVIMLALNPQILAFDVGFQLSFAALIGIIYLTPLLEPYFLWVPKFLRKYLLGTLAAQIFTIPILMYNFGQLSLIALIPNLLVLPIVPLVMLLGFATGVLGLIWVRLAIPIAYITKFVLDYILWVINFFAHLPFAAISWRISFIAVVIYYLLLILVLSWRQYRESLQKMDFTLNLEHNKGAINESQ